MSGNRFEGYIIREALLYTERLKAIGDPEFIYSGLNDILYVLSTNPTSYGIVPMASPGNPLHFIKARVRITDEGVIPPLLIFFSIEEPNIVFLRDIRRRQC